MTELSHADLEFLAAGRPTPPPPPPDPRTTFNGQPAIIVTLADCAAHLGSLERQLAEVRLEIETDQRGVKRKYRKTKRQLLYKEANLLGHIQVWTRIRRDITREDD